MKFKGQITAIARDAATLEVLDTQVVDNIITENFYDLLTKHVRLDELRIVINGMVTAPNRWSIAVPGNSATNSAVASSVPIANLPFFQWFPKTDTTDAYIQYAARFNPPSVDRYIRSVYLAHANDPSNLDWALLNQESYTQCAAYSNLNIECLQTTSQIYDMYYRIFFTDVGASNFSDALFDLMTIGASSADSYNVHSVHSTPVVTKAKLGDEGRRLVSPIAHLWGFNHLIHLGSGLVVDGANMPRRTVDWSSGFQDCAGWIFSSVISGGATDWYWVNARTSFGRTSVNNNPGTPTALASNVVRMPQKIQNLIGHGTTDRPATASPWLDVDNLPTGNGKIYLSGTWNNRETPASPGLYSKTLLPSLNTIQIVNTGAVGTGGKYTFTSRPFFGYIDLNAYFGAGYSSFTISASTYTGMVLPSLCAVTAIRNGAAGHWKWQTRDAGNTLVESIEPADFTARQLSSSIRYDETSFIFVGKAFILLYSVGAGDYWKFKGPFTDIHQVAVANGTIYIACRKTGLYSVSPRQSLYITSLATPATGIDLSKCHGVAEGYDNSLWAVGANGLVSLIGGIWSKYNQDSTIPFSLAGVSDGKWDNIEYLKVDRYSPTYQMHLVRRVDATVDSQYLGVWWSVATAATNSVLDNTAPTTFGRPRLNRTHLGGEQGMWAMVNENRHKILSFGSATVTDVVGGTVIPQNGILQIHSSICFVRNAAGEVRLLTLHDATNTYHPYSATMYMLVAKLVDSSGAITDSMQTAHCYPAGSGYNSTGYGCTPGVDPRSTFGGYGFKDMAASFILDRGAIVSLWCGTESANIGGYIYPQGAGEFDALIVKICNYARSPTLDGGTLAYLAERRYGWESGAWVEDSTLPRTTHAADADLLHGVKVRFENGASGTSFVSPNYYSFGTCEGLLKDNATRHNLKISFYNRRLVLGCSQLSSGVVPEPSGPVVGPVALDPARTSAGVIINAQNDIVFPEPGGGHLAVGISQVVGNFEVQYDTSRLTLPECHMLSQFGVATPGEGARTFLGFHLSSGNVYLHNGASYSHYAYATNPAVLSTVGLRRLGTNLYFLVNDTVVLTTTALTNRMKEGWTRMDLIAASLTSPVVARLIPNRRAPAPSIISTGTDCCLILGNAAQETGFYNPRFYGINSESLDNTVTINGVPAFVKYDGTTPQPGQVSIDARAGFLYFHPADAGLPVECSLDYFKSE